MPNKFNTLAFDSAGDFARLVFSFDMKKHASESDKIRGIQNYPGTTERLNMLVRRLKNFRKAGMEIVWTAHEDVEKLYLKSGGEVKNPEPYAVKGWADIPGRRAPDEFGRAVDNMFHVRRVNGNITWMALPEVIAQGAEWCVKDRFNARAILNGFLPPSYEEIAKLASKNGSCNWKPPYCWLIYGPLGSEKTRSLRTFPKPIKIFDFDRGTIVLTAQEREGIDIMEYDPEESNEYNRFLGDLEACMP